MNPATKVVSMEVFAKGLTNPVQTTGNGETIVFQDKPTAKHLTLS